MLLPVRVQKVECGYQAVLLVAPEYMGCGATTHEAVMALRADLAARTDRGEFVWVNIPQPGEPVGRIDYTEADREMVDEMLAEIYRERDAQKAAEFPE